ncbi:DUF5906 domain-containing protein [Zophobihabitans entericus]|uniref:Bifunctional DNA primase/polymerase n=1 Tax=Zophobihabitans entericus TaxID=1635327 RepID=A0A6G9IBP1_9GAMM|nr:DUF5906 domain-containing protein [Zophobihabitans entericus]QIQ21000.1 bifunctional DNA primase/polymerase [Zophobihabitans entericus]
MCDLTINWAIENNIPFIPLVEQTKHPLNRNWVSTLPIKKDNSAELIKDTVTTFIKNKYGIGLLSGHPINNSSVLVIVDVDIRSVDSQHQQECDDFLISIGLDPQEPNVLTGRGGGSRHYYLCIPTAFAIDKASFKLAQSSYLVEKDGQKKPAWIVELLGKGKFVVAPPSLHPDTGLAYKFVHQNIISEVHKFMYYLYQIRDDKHLKNSISTQEKQSSSALEETKENINRLREVLRFLSSDCDREQWRDIVWSICAHNWKAGKEIAQNWSKNAVTKYNQSAFDIVWESFDSEKDNCIGINTVYYLATEKSWIDDRVHEWLKDMNQKYFKVFVGGESKKMMIGRTLSEHGVSFISIPDFHNSLSNRTINLGGKVIKISKAWLEHPKSRGYESIEFRPEWGLENRNNIYNSYIGWGITPTNYNSNDEFTSVYNKLVPVLKFLKCIICSNNDEHFYYLLGWLHSCVTILDRPLGIALVLRGGKGIGKSFLGKILVKIFGVHGFHATNSELLVGRFNGHLKNCLLYFADEGLFVGDKKAEQALKGLITEDKLLFESKGITPEMAENRIRVVIATNSLHAISASYDERRFFVLDVSDRKAQDHKYFKSLSDYLYNNNGINDLLSFLQSDRLLKILQQKEFHILNIPKSRALSEQKIHSLSEVHRYIYECLSSSGILYMDGLNQMNKGWLGDIGVNILFNAYLSMLNNVRFSSIASPSSFGREFLKIGIAKKIRSSSSGRPWIYRLLPLIEARQMFAENILKEPDFQWES